ncbi:ABC transporter permease [Maribellus maritimus]|uniref:ABC transporter permease n=1 Tax=Maribellus maritimus TaxID=2870838 RepID=UPI001EE9D1F6|nr:ABC transporter permease [Maribellus maritimus]MCG6188719.1 ABC transporter permease [Maribellus maritimus]
MLKNYLTSALRFLQRNKLFAGINILGLSLALAASFIILLFVINELSYNTNFKNRKQIYRVLEHSVEYKRTSAHTPYILSKNITDEFPQVKHVASVSGAGRFSVKLNDELIPVPNAMSANSDIFKIFNIPFVGQQNNILDEPNSIVLSRNLTQKLFPGEDPIGRKLITQINEKEEIFVVKGIFNDIPVNSTIKADCFFSSKYLMKRLTQGIKDENSETNWHSNFWMTWLLLDKNANAASLDEPFRALEKKAFGAEPKYNFSLQNLSDVYLHSQGIEYSGLTGNLKNIRIFSAIALLIIIVAAFNYVILSTAVSTGRTKEIGIRKTSGASVQSIRKQLLNESIVFAMLVLPIALFLATLGKPYAEDLFQTKLLIVRSNIIIYIVVYVVLTLTIGLASGLYTASFLSKLNVISILKNSAQTGRRKSRVRFALIVVQLIIFCSFVSSTLIIRSQYKYALQKDPGYYNHDILFINMGRDQQNSAAFINSIKTYPNIISAGGSLDALPLPYQFQHFNIEHLQDSAKKVTVELFGVDYDFIETMGIQILEGRSFSHEFGSDESSSFLINEAAVKALGITEPIGKPLSDGKIIGVMKDFNFHPLYSEIPPLIVVASDNYVSQVGVHYKPGTLEDLLPLIKSEWEKIAPTQPFNYKTIEEFLKEIYINEKNLSVIISVFALFSLLIASFGLFGLTLFMVKNQTKEIGIKKVIGSSEKMIVFSFLRKNLFMVALASFLSIPPTIFIMNRWLSNFSFKTNIEWWVFALAFVTAALVVLGTVFYHSFRASRVNPVKALRYE